MGYVPRVSGDVVTQKVDAIIISSGERYDFWIDGLDSQRTSTYWIRAETLEAYLNTQVCLHKEIEHESAFKGPFG